MIESQWLSSTDPATMLAHLQQRGLAMAKQLDDYYHIIRQPGATHRRIDIGPSEEASSIRDIWGNPFRGFWLLRSQVEQLLVVTKPQDYLLGSFGSGMASHASVPVNIVEDHWLSWNNHTIPKLAKSIAGGEPCERCVGRGRVERPFRSEFNDSTCDACHGVGKTPPNFADMPILADALEDAGCTNDEILNHCRGMERCGLTAATCPAGEKYNGWLHSTAGHVAGCWILRLLLGE